MSIVRRMLCLGIIVALLFVPAATAQEGSDGFEVEWMDEEDAIEVDGRLDEPVWQGATHSQIELNGIEDEDAERFAQLYLTHNGSALFVAISNEDIDGVTLQIDAASGVGAFGSALDGVEADREGDATDLHWNQDQEQLVADESVEDCGTNSTASTSDTDGASTYEIEKPFSGDTCDAFLSAGTTFSLRILVESDGQTYRWPAGSAEDSVGEWARVTLLDPFGESDGDIARGPEQTPLDPRWETGEEPGVDPNAPPAPGVDTDNPAYNAESERETSAVGWTLLVLVGLAGLGLIAGLRRAG